MLIPFNRAEFELARDSQNNWDASFSSVHVYRSTKAAFAVEDYGQSANIATASIDSFHGFAHFCLEYCDLLHGFLSEPLLQIPLRKIATDDIERRLQTLSPSALKSARLDSSEGFGDGLVLLDDWNEKMLVWENLRDEFVGYYWTTDS